MIEAIADGGFADWATDMVFSRSTTVVKVPAAQGPPAPVLP
jgi:hypothetical protein